MSKERAKKYDRNLPCCMSHAEHKTEPRVSLCGRQGAGAFLSVQKQHTFSIFSITVMLCQHMLLKTSLIHKPSSTQLAH